MKYILDTHTLIWIVTDSPKLSSEAKSTFLNTKNDMYFSMASIWEMAIKISLKKLSLEDSLKDFIHFQIKGNDIKILDITLSQILFLENLSYHHRDPFDRLIISQSFNLNIPIITKDKLFDLYPIKRIW